MQVDVFDFELDRDLIAKEPVSPRDHSRLLDLSEPGVIRDRHFYDLPDLLNPGDVLVFNDTKVIPARLYGAHGEARVEVTLYRPVDGINWWAFVKNSKRLRPGDVVTFYCQEIPAESSDFQAIVIEKKEDDGVMLQFGCQPQHLGAKLEQYGSMPLPPYIKREKPRAGLWDRYNDKENYQTVYAKHEGAVAAPTAGLHFTPRVLDALRQKGVREVFLTLHVGAGTFLPVKTEDTKDHKMHAEYGIITDDAVAEINQARREGKRVIAVGTTSLRLLESAADNRGTLHPFAGDTDIFITPGYKFKIVDNLITNFHLPKSTLFMLVCALAGIDRMKEGYAHAIAEKYRFYSYGDSSILKCVNKI